jgi:hypothetical protein
MILPKGSVSFRNFTSITCKIIANFHRFKGSSRTPNSQQQQKSGNWIRSYLTDKPLLHTMILSLNQKFDFPNLSMVVETIFAAS